MTVTEQKYGTDVVESVHDAVPHCIREDGLLHPTTEGIVEEVISEIEYATSRATMKAV